ncbi:MAG: signal peptidase II [Eggerthellaceae bacterium]|jgi:signal peptidase II|nr:signal peptidase II [Eggerthellaceae bacterium]MDR2716386.1 signal peptidase II [Coriobacteriaceae bacterium]
MGTRHRARRRNILVFVAVAGIWLALDRLTKGYFDGAYGLGQVIAEPVRGLFRFVLVRNTGAAWGILDESTQLLGVVSLFVVTFVVGYFIVASKRVGTLETVALALVAAGGTGNAIDRLAVGYVVDFIEFAFIDFPVFNVADIGVTCGFALFALGMALRWNREGRKVVPAAMEAGPAAVSEAGPATTEAVPASTPEAGRPAPDPSETEVS